MRSISVLSFMALAVSASGECKFDSDSTPLAYSPREYEASWGVAEAAARTTAEFPNVMELLDGGISGMTSDPWVMEVLTQVALGVVFVMLFLMSWCYFSCCRYRITCCCCCFTKKCQSWQPCGKLKPIMGKVILVCAYFLVIIVGLTAFNGKSIIGASIPTMADGMTDLGNALTKFVNLSGDQVSVVIKLKSIGQELEAGACDFEYVKTAGTSDEVAKALEDQMVTVNDALRTSSTALVEAMDATLTAAKDVESTIKDADSSINDAMSAAIDMLTGLWDSYLDPATLAFALIFVLAGLMGLASAGYTNAYKCTLCLIWTISILVMILTAILLLFSIVLGDLCVPKPTQNIANLVPSSGDAANGDTSGTGSGSDSGGGDFIQFFVACKGKNPMDDVAEEILKSTTTMLEDSCNLLTDIKPAEMSINISLPTPTTQKVQKKNPKACEAAIGDPDTFIGLQGGMAEIQGILVSIVKEIKSCKFVNEPLTAFLEEGLCNGFAGGFYSMYASLFSAIWFTVLAMFITFPAWDVADGTAAAQAGGQKVAPAGAPAAAPAAAPEAAAPAPAPEAAAPAPAKNDANSLPPI